MKTSINTMDKAIDLELRRQELHDETLKAIKELFKVENRVDGIIEIIADCKVEWSAEGNVYVGEVTETEARIFYDGKRISQVQLKVLNVDKLLEILFAINASV